MSTPQIYNHLTANGHMRKRDIIVGNFIGGLFWGLGSVIGATIVVAIIIGVLRNFKFVPGFDTLNTQLSNSVTSKIQNTK